MKQESPRCGEIPPDRLAGVCRSGCRCHHNRPAIPRTPLSSRDGFLPWRRNPPRLHGPRLRPARPLPARYRCDRAHDRLQTPQSVLCLIPKSPRQNPSQYRAPTPDMNPMPSLDWCLFPALTEPAGSPPPAISSGPPSAPPTRRNEPCTHRWDEIHFGVVSTPPPPLRFYPFQSR